MERRPGWAAWLLAQRASIDRRLGARLGAAGPTSDAPEAEALRRFRSFAISALRRGQTGAPALDGLRLDPGRVGGLLDAWCETAGEAAGPGGAELRALLAPLVERFRQALLSQGAARGAARARPATRRAVSSAIDRVADAFLAVDLESGRIVDANPAAGSLLGVARDALLGREAPHFLPGEALERWKTHLEALEESPEPQRFHAALRDAGGGVLPVEVSATRYARRGGPLALILARLC